MLLLFAQAADPISGGGGWVGAGLLGLVLGWLLLVHLPAKDKQILGLIEAADARLEKAQATFDGAIKAVVSHCEGEMTEVTAAFREQVDRLVAKKG